MAVEHRGGLLHIVSALMKQRVEGETRTPVKIEAVAAPGHFSADLQALQRRLHFLEALSLTDTQGSPSAKHRQAASDSFL